MEEQAIQCHTHRQSEGEAGLEGGGGGGHVLQEGGQVAVYHEERES